MERRETNWAISPNAKLLHNARIGNLEQVTEWLNKGANVNFQWDKNHATPLIHASNSGHFQVVNLLLEKGAEVDLFGYGHTALMRACDKGHGAVVRLLLSHGADVNLKSKTLGRTPLMFASLSNQVLVTELLLNLTNIEVEEKDQTGYTALILMCMRYLNGFSPTARQRWLLTAQLLLRNGANPNYHTVYRSSPLQQASMRGNLDMVKLLVQYGAEDDEEERALKAAKANNHQDVITFLELPSDKQKLYYLKLAFSTLHTLH